MAIVRLVARALCVVALIGGFTGLAAVLHVRSAIARGALEQPRICLDQRHADWRTGSYPDARTLWFTADQVRYFYLDGRSGRMADWHVRGAFAGLGVWLGYSKEEQRAMAERVIAAMPACPDGR